jgi:hypothetical protein
MQKSKVKRQKWSRQSTLVLIFAALAFIMIFFSAFGPLSNKLIPFNPMGWAGIFIYLSMIFCYSQKYEKSKDVFWFILTLIFFPLLISDLYFFPIPKLLGLGMFEWGGIQIAVCFICFIIFSKVKILRFTNLLMLILFPAFAAAFEFPQLVPSAFRFLLLLYLVAAVVVVAISLSYYSYLHKEYLLIVGIFLNFIVTGLIVILYLTTGFLPFGWSEPLMAVITDRISIFGRILMVLNLPMIRDFVQHLKGNKNNQ